MKRVLITILFMTDCAFMMSAQELEGFGDYAVIPREKVIEKFGNPETYQIEDHDVSDPVGEYYYYDGLTLAFEDRVISRFGIKKRGIRVLTKTIPGGVLVGDNFSKISSLQIHNRGVKGDGTTQYDYWCKGDDTSKLTFYVKNNIIQEISFVVVP